MHVDVALSAAHDERGSRHNRSRLQAMEGRVCPTRRQGLACVAVFFNDCAFNSQNVSERGVCALKS